MKIIRCNQGDFVWVQVKKGQDMDMILQQYSTTINNIIRNNPSIDLYEGEMIKIITKTHLTHVVKPMETLHTIAKKYNLDIDKIVEINDLNSSRLFIGQILKID